MNDLAIVVDSVGFRYDQRTTVLDDVNVHVPKGTIYTLLGSNGCGKTTLLRILLGRLRARHGDVYLLGHRVNATTRLNHFVGYMPQSIALNPGLTIGQTFHYFARLNHVTDGSVVEHRLHAYLDMLDLTDADRPVAHLSGGQKRLLSLGVTMIYEPPILLLDEPTVGVDSLIRKKIWQHLAEICHQKGTTVMITTHYIDEAKQSDLVGFLKEGRMLAEESPRSLMTHLFCVTLEEVFYKLCLWQNHSLSTQQTDRYTVGAPDAKLVDSSTLNQMCRFRYRKAVSPVPPGKSVSGTYRFQINQSALEKGNPDEVTIAQVHSTADTELQRPKCAQGLVNWAHIGALAYRECLLYRSATLALFLMTVIPVLSITAFQLSYGRTPHSVPVALVNHDRSTTVQTLNDKPHNLTVRLSDLYIDKFNDSLVRLVSFPDEQSAFDSVRAGRSVIAVAFRHNFTNSFIKRYMSLGGTDRARNGLLLSESEVDEEEADAPDGSTALNRLFADSSIHIYIDMSRTLTVRYFNRSLLYAFQQTVEEFGVEMGLNPYLFSTPIEIDHIYYGGLQPNLQPVFTAGVVIVVLLITSVLTAGMGMVVARDNGCLERDLNQSVRPLEYLVAAQLVSLVPTTLVVVVTLLVTFYVIQVPLAGSFAAVLLLVLLSTAQGLFLGVLISVLSKSTVIVMVLCFTALTVIFFTSGILWPVEGMPRVVQRVFLLNPITIPVQSLRNIMLRGWPLWHPRVYIGCLTSLVNCAVLFVVEAVLFQHTANT